jgi:hypothetical protein
LGANDLERGLESELLPGRIYAGLTGATKWPSDKVGKMSLRARKGGNHLAGHDLRLNIPSNASGNTAEPLELQLESPGRVERDSERRLSAWMRQHLEVAVYPFPTGMCWPVWRTRCWLYSILR